MKSVYHSSKISHLKEITPRMSSHGKSWVYATKDLATSAIFLGNHSDLIIQIGHFQGKVYMFERFTGAFEYAYKDQQGSIYLLPGETFLENQTGWSIEVVSPSVIIPSDEIIVTDTYEYIKELIDQDLLTYYQYPHMPEFYKDGIDNDTDLVEISKKHYQSGHTNIVDKLAQFHPHLVARFNKELNRV